jgi:hypothetical protein
MSLLHNPMRRVETLRLPVTSPRRRHLRLAIAIAGLLTFAVSVPALAADPEGCPGTSTLVAEFDHGAAGWAPSGSSAGITITGDSSTAFWTSPSAISAVVITAGTVTQNFTLDPPETTGQISSSDVEDAAGGALVTIGFCQGTATNPSSGSSISIDLVKTAQCATANPDGTYTVTGTITVSRHSPEGNPPQVSIRVKVARDVVLAPGDVVLQRATVTTLEGAILEPGTESITQPYSVTFDAMGNTALTNKVEVMVEEAVSGLDRHKYYSDRQAFELCAAESPTPTPTPTPTPPAAPTPPPAGSPTQTQSPGGGQQVGTPTPREGQMGGLPSTSMEEPSQLPAAGLSLMLLASLGALIYTRMGRLSRQR